MSGGSYNYAYRRLEDFADELRCDDGGCYPAPAPLRRAFAEHCRKVARAMKALEWNDSGDGDDEEAALLAALVSSTARESRTVEELRLLRAVAEAALNFISHRSDCWDFTDEDGALGRGCNDFERLRRGLAALDAYRVEGEQ